MLEKNFMVRYAALDFQRGMNIVTATEKADVDKVLTTDNKNFDSILLSVSPSIVLGQGNSAKIEATKLKYMDRAATRTTPLGLMAGVMMGKFQERENYNIDLKQNLMNITVDREWLDKVLCQIKIKSMYDRVSLNPAIYIFKDKIKNIWVTSDQSSKEHDVAMTPPLKEVIKILSHKVILRYKLVNYLIEKFKQPKGIITSFINQLIDENIILSDLSNIVLFKEPLDSLIKTIKQYKDIKFASLLNKLKNIRTLIAEMETKGFQKSNYHKAVEIMKSLAVSPHYLHIDLYNSTIIGFPANQKSRITDFGRFLVVTSSHPDSLKEFKNAFKDKYSINTLVNFKEVFNPRTGLDTLKMHHEENDWLRKELYNSLKNNDSILKLESEKWVRDLKDNVNFSSSDNVNMELALIPFTKNKKISYAVSPLVGAVGKGNVEGRFSKLKLFNQDDNEYQLIYEPQIKRVTNILKNINNNKTLGFNTFPLKNGISVKDIFILLDSEEKFHLFYKGKEIKASYFSMVSQEVTPTELSFLSIIGKEKSDKFQIVRLIEQYKEKNFITPEVWYKNFLISGKSWNIEYFVTKDTKSEDIRKFLIKKINKIDKIVYWENGDNRILVNLETPFFINELVKSLKKRGYLRLEKCYFSSKNLILSSSDKKHLGEFVFRFSKDKYLKNSSSPKIGVIKKHELSAVYNNSFFMNPRWTEFQIYLKPEDMNDFLVTKLTNLNHQIPYFYIRYKSMDKGDHIRLRLQMGKDFKSEIFKIVNRLKLQYKNQQIRDLSINIYEREIDRYGEQSIEKVEHIFCLESELAINILMKYHNLPDELWKIVFYHNISILLACEDIEDAISIFDKFDDIQDRKKLNKDYREFKKEDMPCQLQNNKNFKKIVRLLKELKENEERDMFIETILSIQHLFHNRVIGIDISSEAKMNYFIKKYLKNIWYSIKENAF